MFMHVGDAVIMCKMFPSSLDKAVKDAPGEEGERGDGEGEERPPPWRQHHQRGLLPATTASPSTSGDHHKQRKSTTKNSPTPPTPFTDAIYDHQENRAKFWYSIDYGMFHFCIADTEPAVLSSSLPAPSRTPPCYAFTF
ncbi:uncharacterized protein LOC131317438 [Rhododendron vialii]|uniref:uncharacterized protein LOC131317438 n=1 Tax=Rhododendron vialii TaxID=182163 RepID=UPI00265EC675|nr:uncharacterized protein LOC131317438 [Rhododendron vialii]